MKKNYSIIAILFLISIFYYSCQSDDYENSLNDSQTQEELQTFNFIYKGTHYSCYYVMVDSIMQFENTEIGRLINNLQKLPELATYIHDNDLVEFFDNHQDLMNELTAIQTKRAKTTFPPLPTVRYISNAYLTVYDDTNLKDTNTSFTISAYPKTGPIVNPVYPSLEVTSFKPYKLEDKISSMKWSCDVVNSTPPFRSVNIVVTFYEHPSFGGQSLTFNELNINYTYSERRSFKSFNFNDKASSMRFYLVQGY